MLGVQEGGGKDGGEDVWVQGICRGAMVVERAAGLKQRDGVGAAAGGQQIMQDDGDGVSLLGQVCQERFGAKQVMRIHGGAGLISQQDFLIGREWAGKQL